MLDRLSAEVLNIINGNVYDGGYTVLEIDGIAKQTSDKNATAEQICECLDCLRDKEFISVKYQDDREVCLSALPKGRAFFEKKLEDEMEKQSKKQKYFVYSFLGGLVGGVTTAVVIFILSLIFGGGRVV